MRGLEKALGLGTPARDGRIVQIRYEGVEVRVSRNGEAVRKDWVTPIGTVSQVDVESLRGYATDALPAEFPIKSVDDYAVVEYIWEHTYFDSTYEAYQEYEKQVGEDGYPMVDIGDCPFHHFIHRLAGYDNAYFELMDHLPQVEHLLTVMRQTEMERLWPLVFDSPARLFLHGYHFDSQMTPPRLFDRYITPYYQQVMPTMRVRGKHVAYHADDDAKAILQQVKASGLSMAECFCTAPMVGVTLAEARQAWGNDVIIWGGVPSVILEETSMKDEEFEEYMLGVFRAVAPGDAFILGVGDNVMPMSKIERVIRIGQMVEDLGHYPIVGL
ncbi:MAG: uroporphyrinogen decarboxylase family protein [Chloroflexota bacterium]